MARSQLALSGLDPADDDAVIERAYRQSHACVRRTFTLAQALASPLLRRCLALADECRHQPRSARR
jgi:hypothetical protein